jgi:hypothetical protein
VTADKLADELRDKFDDGASIEDDAPTWLKVDLGPVVTGLLDGTLTRPEPTVGRLTDGSFLFYRARVNGLFGESGDGKTLVAQFTAGEVLARGGNVIYLDFEDNAEGAVGRLLDLGADPAQILSGFHYVSPDEPFGFVAQGQMTDLVGDVRPALIVIDSTGESMALDGVKPNDDDAVARWSRRLPLSLARLGPCVLTVDHVTKSREARGLYAIGSQRKRAAITGAAYLVESVIELGQGRRGIAKLTTAKDRCGNRVRGRVAAEFVLDATGAPYDVSLRPPIARDSGSAFQPTALMERISRFVELNPGLSKNSILAGVKGAREFKQMACELLVEEGYLVLEPGANRSQLHRSVKPFREAPE